MELQTSPARRVLDGIKGSLDGFDAGLVGRGERLECAQLARRLASRLTALAGVLVAQADAANESMSATGAPTSTWLALHGGLSKREASAMVHQGHDIGEILGWRGGGGRSDQCRPGTGDRWGAGRVGRTRRRAADGPRQVLLGMAASWIRIGW